MIPGSKLIETKVLKKITPDATEKKTDSARHKNT